MWMVGAAVLALLTAGVGTAAARENESGGAVSSDTTTVSTTTTTVKSPQAGRKPRPSPTTTTASPTSSPTPSPTVTVTTTPPSTGDADIAIPLAGFGDILVDEAHGHLFLSGGKGTRDLIVSDLDGGNLRTLAGIAPGGAGMTLSPDGTKLYVAASDSDGITIVDTTTFATSWYWTGTSDGTMTCPRDVAVAAGQLWFSWGCDGGFAGIGRVDPQTGAFDLNVAQVDSRITSPPLLATVPSQPDMVIAGETGTNPALVFRFQATSTELVQQAMRWTDGGSVRQLAITPDGSEVIVPSGAPYYHPVFRTSDLVEVHQYPTAAYPNAAAVRSDGLVAAGINGAYERDVYVFEPNGTTPIATYEFGHLPDQETWAYTLADGALAWHGDRIYAVTEQLSEPDTVTLRIRALP